jgi:hypothetical protein
MTEDENDELNLADLEEVEAALIEARQALVRAMMAPLVPGRGEREKFVFKVGFARGRLERVADRIYRKADA